MGGMGRHFGVSQVLLFNVFLSIVLYSQTVSLDSYLIKSWSLGNGLPMNSVLCMAQTEDGYLWLGTEIGLARFDGLRFTLFDRDNTLQLKNDYVISLLVDRKGVLWIGTRGGGIVQFHHNRFHRPFPEEFNESCRDAWEFMEASDGAVWIGCRCGLFRCLPDGAPSSIPITGNREECFVRTLIEDRNGRIWIGTRGGGVFFLEKSGNSYFPVPQGLAGVNVEEIFEDRRGCLWVGSTGSGLFRRVGEEWIPFCPGSIPKDNSPSTFFEDRWNNLWIGNSAGGITLVDAERRRVRSFDHLDDLPCPAINQVMEDQERNIWIATGGGGLLKLREPLVKTYTRRQGLSSDMTASILQDDRGDIWVGTLGKGVNRLRLGRFAHLDRSCGLSGNAILSIAQTPDGTMWFGTVGNGLTRYRQGVCTVFDRPQGLAGKSVRCLYVDDQGVLWIGTGNGWIQVLREGRIEPYLEVGTRINCIRRDRIGRLWVGTMGSGLLRYHSSAKESFDTRSGFCSDMIISIFEDSYGIIWVGTSRDGLVAFSGNRIRQIRKAEGIPDHTVYQIVEDSQKNLWISCNRGVFCLHRRQVEEYLTGRINRFYPIIFGIEQGMKSLECNGGSQPTGCCTREGKIVFPTTCGIVEIDPKLIQVNKYPPQVCIEKVLFDDRELPFPITTVPPGKGNLEIRYTAPTFISPERTVFKYRLDGVDPFWVEGGEDRVARYHGLSPGRYRFRLTAGNSDGVWNLDGVSLQFTWQGRIFQSTWFKVSAISLLLVFHVGLIFFRGLLGRWRKRRRKQDRNLLSSGQIVEYLEKIGRLLETDRIYRDSTVSVQSLASRLLLSPRLVSQLINDHLHLNFFELINFYRIREAQGILSGEKGESILQVCYRVGYNSKSAFNRAFKQISGMTPSEFLKKGALGVKTDPRFGRLPGFKSADLFSQPRARRTLS